MLLLIIAMTLLGLGTFLALEFATVHGRQSRDQLRRAGTYAIVSEREKELSKGASERLLQPLVKRLSNLAMRMSPQGSRMELGRKMQAAGLTTSPQVVLAVKGGLTFGGVIVGLLGALVFRYPALLPIGLGISAVGFIGPDFWLGTRARKRRDEMGRVLADTLDLLTVSVEAGLGFDAAVNKVCEKMKGPLIDELSLMAREIRIGETRRQALRNLAERVGSPEVASFARSIIQAEELGTALGRTLRVQAVDMRIKRQLAAEEKAMKAPVKMLFPTVLFIFPAMFIIILGPAALNIMSSFGG